MTSTLTDKAVVGRRILHDHASLGPDQPGIITRLNDEVDGGGFYVRLDGRRHSLFVPPKFESRITYLDQVVSPVPELPMGRFIPVRDDANAIWEKEDVLFSTIGEDGEDLVLITDDRAKAWKAASAYFREAGIDIDPDYVNAGDLEPKWAYFEWQPEDAECPWFVHWTHEGDDMAIQLYYLPA